MASLFDGPRPLLGGRRILLDPRFQTLNRVVIILWMVCRQGKQEETATWQGRGGVCIMFLSSVIPCVIIFVTAAGGFGDCCGEAGAGGLSKISKPFRGFPFFAALSICTCCKVDGAPSDLKWRGAAAGVANSCHSAAGSCFRTRVT